MLAAAREAGVAESMLQAAVAEAAQRREAASALPAVPPSPATRWASVQLKAGETACKS